MALKKTELSDPYNSKKKVTSANLLQYACDEVELNVGKIKEESDV